MCKTSAFQEQWHLINNRLMRVGFAIILACVASIISPLFDWMHIWLKGQNFSRYLLIFIPTLFVFFCLFPRRYQQLTDKPYWVVVYGILLGYTAGLFSFLFMGFLTSNGSSSMVRNLEHLSTYWVVVLGGPFLTMSWLFGAIVGLIFALLITKSRRNVLLLIVILFLSRGLFMVWSSTYDFDITRNCLAKGGVWNKGFCEINLK